VTVQAGTTKFYVTSNTNWTVSSNSPWCTVTPAGSLSDSITVTYAANTAVGQRIDTVTVMAAGVGGERVTVIQEGIPALLAVDPPNQNVAALLGNTTFTVTSNTDWTAISDATWCTITPSGSGNGTIVADFTENTAHLSRVANIQVTVPTLPAQTVTVTQGKSTIGIGEQSLNAVKIYPNPTRGVFKIVPAQGNNALDVTVQDLNGKVILQKECRGESEYEISLADAPQGTYDIIIKSGSEKLVRKLVIIK
jgi:hypothetical protein